MPPGFKKMKKLTKPQPSDYNPFYQTYLDQVGDQDVIEILQTQRIHFEDMLNGLEEERLAYRYAPDKWTIAEVIGHMLDTERVFAYRLLCISRNEKTPLPGFDQDLFIVNGHFNHRSKLSFLNEFKGQRQANLELIGALTEKQLSHQGTASGWNVSCKALVFLLAGHFSHHLSILKTRYL